MRRCFRKQGKTSDEKVVFQANDMTTLLSGMEALQSSADMAAYLKNANSFRSVVSRTVGVNVWSSPMPSN
jgi:hypothetical protein